jgi:hypothetical protein
MLTLYTCSLIANITIEVIARVVTGVSVGAATRVAIKTAAKNKSMKLIGSQLLSLVSVA